MKYLSIGLISVLFVIGVSTVVEATHSKAVNEYVVIYTYPAPVGTTTEPPDDGKVKVVHTTTTDAQVAISAVNDILNDIENPNSNLHELDITRVWIKIRTTS